MVFKLALAQYPITKHESFDAWATHVEIWVNKAANDDAKILVFPEYGSLELVSLMSKEIQKDLKVQIEQMNSLGNKFRMVYKQLAEKYKVYILAPSIPIKFDKIFINRAYFFSPKGKIAYQDKLSMTRFEDEEWGISSSTPELFIFETAFGVVGINICFDSEFPQYAFELAQAGVQLLLVPSCTETPAGLSRVQIGSRARALENQIYVGVSSTVGDCTWSSAVDFNTGQAGVYAPADGVFPSDGIIETGNLNKISWLITEINLKKIEEVRKSGSVFNFKKITESTISNPKLKITRIVFT